MWTAAPTWRQESCGRSVCRRCGLARTIFGPWCPVPAAAIVCRLVSEERDAPTLLAGTVPFTACQVEQLT